MAFTNTLYLWTLLGLGIPIAIHLWSKKEGKTIKVGSIKNLKESDSKQSSSIKLNELLLLFLRMLFLALISFILTEPYLKKNIKNSPTQYIVEPSLFLDSDYSHILDSLKTESTLLLSEGLPSFDEVLLNQLSKETPKYWQLVSQMESIKADSIVVFSYAYSKGVKGMRPEVNANVNWLVLDNKNPLSTLLSATKKENGTELLAFYGDSKNMRFTKEIYKSDTNALQYNAAKDSILITLEGKKHIKALNDKSQITVLLDYNDRSAQNAMYLKAALQAISEYTHTLINIDTTKSEDFSTYNAIISLSDELKTNTEMPLLIYKPDPFAKHLIEQGSKSNLFYLTKDLNTELSIKNNLTEQLLYFLDLNRNINTDTYNKLQLDQIEIQPKKTLKKLKAIKEKSKVSISPWLWLFAIFTLMFERGIAFYRKQ